MSSVWIQNGRVVCPAQGIDRIADLYIRDGKIVSIGHPPETADVRLDATGLVVAPGLVDMHVHLRDPGFTHKEDVLTGCEAAAAGGVTTVVAMPNTNPVVDSPERLSYLIDKAKSAKARVYPVAAITHGIEGATLCDFAELRAAGAVAVSDDGRPVKSARMMQQALEAADAAGLPVISHCEDLEIINGGILNAGRVSAALGVKGMHRSSEDSITAREIALAEATGTAVHIAHVSTRGSIAVIRDAKRRGARVTCETCPHYFTLTEDRLLTRDADYRMNPPLREQADVDAVLAGLQEGTVDCIVTDHAPHTAAEKADFETAPNGVVGLETSLAASLTRLYHQNGMPLLDLLAKMTVHPARILGLPVGTLRAGADADLVLFDPDAEWTVEPEKLHSKSKNTAFKGMTLKGKVLYTFKSGEIVYSAHR